MQTLTSMPKELKLIGPVTTADRACSCLRNWGLRNKSLICSGDLHGCNSGMVSHDVRTMPGIDSCRQHASAPVLLWHVRRKAAEYVWILK